MITLILCFILNKMPNVYSKYSIYCQRRRKSEGKGESMNENVVEQEFDEISATSNFTCYLE